MNRLIIDKACQAKVKNATLIVDDNAKIPLKAIDALYISHKVDMDLRSLVLIAKADIPVVIVTTRPKEFVHIQKAYHKNADLKEAQYRALSRRVDIARQIIAKKIANAAATLKSLHIDFESSIFLKELDAATDIQELLGIEGNMARRYFGLYFSIFPKLLAKGSRTKNPPKDPVNALLSYLYTVLYYEIATRLVYYGFEPSIGYLHKAFREHMALASDLLETIRGDIDLFAAGLLLDAKLLPRHFTRKADAVYLTDRGRKELWSHLKEFLERKETKIKKEIAWIRDIVEKNSTSDPTPK